jgi:enoyl-CoA hydratase/carnithine racemase
MRTAAYALEPVEALDAAAVDRVRRIYEEGFPPRLRADFSAVSDHRQAGELALALVSGGQPYGFAMLRPLGGTGWMFLHGSALGAGCEFALGCDLVVAAEDAQFGFP